MNSEVQIFNNEEFGTLSVVMIDGKPHLPATECARILEYEKPHDAISRHCRHSVTYGVPHPQSPEKQIEKNFIPEGDLYRLIIKAADQSRNPEIKAKAEKFERWVSGEVIPALKKDETQRYERDLRSDGVAVPTGKGLQIFTSVGFGYVRFVEINGIPYAVGVDVARVLEYEKPGKAVADHCKDDPLTWGVIDKMGREQQTRVIAQGDIYRLIVKAADQSRNPEMKAKSEKFERWIFGEVFPALKKDEIPTVSMGLNPLNNRGTEESTSNELQLFSYDGIEIRTIRRDGEVWWVAKDVCDVFGETNRNRAMQGLDDEEKGYTQMNTPGGKQDMAIVNLPGLYALLLAMQPEKARGVSDEYIAQRQAKLKAFRRWVTHEVLPSIHKHGAYMTEATIDRVISDPDFGIKLLQTLKDERAKNAVLTETISVQTQQITEMQPKASYYDVVLNCKDALSITTIAKDYGKSAKWMNEKLHELGVQFKQGGIWHLYQKYAEDGYTCTKTHNHPGSDGEIHAKNHTYWTQKGRFFLYELLKENGYVPVMERQLTAA